MLSANDKKVLTLSGLGGVLEFYDFVIYALFASEIAKEFFPLANDLNSLVTTFATFSVGYLARPIGGLIFGHFGDKIGRKKSFTISIAIMAFATFSIGLVPSYATIGIAAPILIILLRIIQGISIGGEIPGAIAFVSESMPARRGFACGIVFFFLISGIVLGSLVHSIMVTTISGPNMLAWGWRLPFLIGGVFGFISYLLRQGMEESSLFKKIEKDVEKLPVKSLLASASGNVFAGVFVTAVGAALVAALFLFIPSYFKTVIHVNSTDYSWYLTLCIFLSALLSVVFGRLADKLSVKLLMYWLIALTLMTSYGIFYIYSYFIHLYLVSFLFSALLVGFAWGVTPVFLSNLFDIKYRYTGIALSYNVSSALFGGLTPLVSIFLIYKTGLSAAPAFYLCGIALFALVCLFFCKNADGKDFAKKGI